MAETVAGIFTEVIIAPAYEAGAVEVLKGKKNIRVLVAAEPQPAADLTELGAAGDDPNNWTLATGTPADAQTLTDLVFAWRTCRAVKSNAIVI
ncbi:bifunctional phosphoribosylaminoimidazolecarboxamide formyltransferase/inosine monophosphate cyclohydrolase, partial [Mycobacterium sp. ITM-2017-0098]